MSSGYYGGEILSVTRKLDGKGRLNLPSDFREALGFAPDEEVIVSAVSLMNQGKQAIMITRKEQV